MNVELRSIAVRSAPNARTLKRIARIRNEVRIIRGCLIFLTAVAAIAAAVAASGVLAPTAIAVVLALVLAPVAHMIERVGLPPGISSVLAVAVTFLMIAGIGVAMAPAMNDWLERAPEIARDIERRIDPIRQQIAAVDSVSQSITQVTQEARPVTPPPPGGILSTAVREAPSAIAKIVYVTILTIFLLAFRRRYTEQLILMPRRFRNRCRMSRICRDVQLRVSSYLFTMAMINIGLAVITTGAFHLLGVADPLLWGVAFGILNFIPVIGPTAVIGASALVGLAGAETLTEGLAPPLFLLALNTVEANIVQPWLLSRRIVISPIAIFVTVALLLWMWGAAAAITAVPLLILFHTVSLHVPSLRPVGELLATVNGNGHSARREQRAKARAAEAIAASPECTVDNGEGALSRS